VRRVLIIKDLALDGTPYGNLPYTS
jgi:hypothetical protein